MATQTLVHAVDLSPEEIEEQREEAQSLDQKIKGAIQLGKQAAWILAQGFYEFSETQGYRVLGYESLSEWLAQPEVSVTERTFFRYAAAYRETVVAHQIPMESMGDIDPTKVELVVPAIKKSRVTVDEALADMKALGARDLREKYIGAQSAPKRADAGDPDASGTDAEGNAVGADAQEGQEPVQASVPLSEGEDRVGASEDASGAQDGQKPYLVSALQVDSWITMGGDKRKAARHWVRMQFEHPALKAAYTITSFFEGGDDAPTKAEVAEAWAMLLSEFDIDPSAV